MHVRNIMIGGRTTNDCSSMADRFERVEAEGGSAAARAGAGFTALAKRVYDVAFAGNISGCVRRTTGLTSSAYVPYERRCDELKGNGHSDWIVLVWRRALTSAGMCSRLVAWGGWCDQLH